LHQRVLYPILIVLLTVAGIVSAQSPEWRYGGRISWVNTGASSDELGDTGSTLDVRSGPGVEFDATLMFSDLFGVELSIGTSAHRLQFSAGDLETNDTGTLWLLPLTAIAQYHHPIYGPWDPYVGLGVTWAAPFFKMSGNASDAGVKSVEFDGGPAVAAQIGVNYQMDNRWYGNIDLRYAGTSVDAQVRIDEENLPTVTLDIKPLVISLGFGYKF
jgi:outer membrane protein